MVTAFGKPTWEWRSHGEEDMMRHALERMCRAACRMPHAAFPSEAARCLLPVGNSGACCLEIPLDLGLDQGRSLQSVHERLLQND